MGYKFGGAPDDYARPVGSLVLLTNTVLTVTDAETGGPVANLFDAAGDPVTGGQISTDDAGEYEFTCDSPVVILTGGGRTWKVPSVEALSEVVDVLPQAQALAGAAQASAIDAAASRSAAEAAQAAAEAAAAGAGAGGVDGTEPATISAEWTFQASPIVPDLGAASPSGAAANRAAIDGLGTSAATAGAVARRDSAGRMRVAAPSDPSDVANLSTVLNVGSADAEVSTVVRRDSSGRARFAAPAAANDAATKGYADGTFLGVPIIDATGGTTVPAGTAAGTFVARLATPDPAAVWTATGETTSGAVPVSWQVPATAVPGQVAVVVCVMAGLGTWTAPSGATVIHASAQGAGMTTMVYGVVITADMLGTSRQVAAASIPAGTRAKATAFGVEGVTLSGLTAPALTVQGTATATPTVPGVAAAGAGVTLSVLAAKLTAVVADGGHWTGWPSGTTEFADDAVATTTSAATVSIAGTVRVPDAAEAAVDATPTSDLGAVTYVTGSIFLPALPAEASGGGGSAAAGAGTDAWLRWYARDPESMAAGVIERTSLGCPTSFSVEWPFGAGTGVCAAVPSTVDAKVPDSWTVTFVPAGGGTERTVTQPLMTRDTVTGAVIDRPALTVA